MEEKLRAALSRGFHVDNLWAIVRVCNELLRNEALPDPVVTLAIKATCTELARAYEGEAIGAELANLVDAHLLAAIEDLDASAGDHGKLIEALNDLARVSTDLLKAR